MYARHMDWLMWSDMQMHICIFESLQIEGLYVGVLLYRIWISTIYQLCHKTLMIKKNINAWWTWSIILSSVQLLSHVRLSATPWTAAHQASLSITNSWNLLKLMSMELVMPTPHLGTQQRDWEPWWNLTLEAIGICLQDFHRSGETDSWEGTNKTLRAPGDRRKEQCPHKRPSQVPVSVQESPAEGYADSLTAG